jgi:hypothetical protein
MNISQINVIMNLKSYIILWSNRSKIFIVWMKWILTIQSSSFPWSFVKPCIIFLYDFNSIWLWDHDWHGRVRSTSHTDKRPFADLTLEKAENVNFVYIC